MKPDRNIIITAGLCSVAILASLFARTSIHPSAPATLPAPVETAAVREDRNATIVVHFHERPPYYVSQGSKVGGIIGERITAVFQEAGIPLRWQQSPPKRQLEIIAANEGRAGAAGWFRTPSREAFAKFSQPIYQDRPTIALARADCEAIRPGRRIADALATADLCLLRKDSYSYGAYIDTLLDRIVPHQAITTTDNMGMLKMIRSHRADYFFIASEEAEDLLKRSGLSAADVKTITFADMPEGNCRYILFSRQVDDATIACLNRVIDRYGIAEPSAERLQ